MTVEETTKKGIVRRDFPTGEAALEFLKRVEYWLRDRYPGRGYQVCSGGYEMDRVRALMELPESYWSLTVSGWIHRDWIWCYYNYDFPNSGKREYWRAGTYVVAVQVPSEMEAFEMALVV